METGASSSALEAFEAEYALLQKKAALSEERADVAEREAEAYRQQIAKLTHELAQLKRLVFGVKSERFEPSSVNGQLPLFAGAPTEEPAPVENRARTPSVARAKKKPSRQVLPSHLPREVITIEPDVDTSCLKKIGEEVSETLDYRPARLVVIRRVRSKYVDPAEEERGVIIASLPWRPIDKGIAEPGLLAHMLIAKYCDHMPYYRQAQQFRREGVTLAESTIGDWGRMSAELLTPLYDRLVNETKASTYIQADETPIAVKDRSKKGKTHRGYYWVYLAPDDGLVCMDYQPGRGRDGPTAWLDGYRGALQSDGYAVYDAYGELDHVTGYNCWAHARRKFFDAQENAPDLAEEVLLRIRGLYEIERMLRETDPTPERRLRVREEKANPILKQLKVFLEANGALPQDPWGKAVRYCLTRWEKLVRYTEDGRIEIDTNLVENAIRPIALGRKNYLFAGSHAAAQRAAVIYSLLSTCKLHDVNPQTWLSDVLSRIATHPVKRIDELLPHRWEKNKM